MITSKVDSSTPIGIMVFYSGPHLKHGLFYYMGYKAHNGGGGFVVRCQIKWLAPNSEGFGRIYECNVEDLEIANDSHLLLYKPI